MTAAGAERDTMTACFNCKDKIKIKEWKTRWSKGGERMIKKREGKRMKRKDSWVKTKSRIEAAVTTRHFLSFISF